MKKSRSTKKKHTRRAPRSIKDLAACPRNPRTITPEALAGLGAALTEYGDLSGIVWNKRTGQLVAGHQRIKALKKGHGRKLKLVDGALLVPDGERFPVRVVDWPADKAKAAMLVANNQHIAGDFVPEAVAKLCAELSDTLAADLYASLDLDKLVEDCSGEPGLTDADAVPGELSASWSLVCVCQSENEAQSLYEKLTKEGYECRVLNAV